MIQNFSLQDSWLLEHQDKELFDAFDNALELINDNLDKLIPYPPSSPLAAVGLMTREGRELWIQYKNSHGLLMVNPTHLMFLMNKRFNLLCDMKFLYQKESLSWDLIWYFDPAAFEQYTRMWFSVDDIIKWICVLFKYNDDRNELEFQTEKYEELESSIPEYVKIKMEYFQKTIET